MNRDISKIKLVELPKIIDKRGNLSFLESNNHVPFKIERTYWIYDVPGGEIRGGHAFKKQNELIIALSGSFSVIVSDGDKEQEYYLNRSYTGLYVPAGIWRHMENFSTNSLAIVLADTSYSEEDYIRDKNIYINE